jgi:hypothetical protein
MATIYGVTGLTFAVAHEVQSEFQGTIGRAHDGSFKVLEFASPSKPIVIYLRHLEESKMSQLKSALETAVKRQGSITPDATIDLGNGAGVTVNVQWVDRVFRATRRAGMTTYDVDLNFVYIS